MKTQCWKRAASLPFCREATPLLSRSATVCNAEIPSSLLLQKQTVSILTTCIITFAAHEFMPLNPTRSSMRLET